MASISVAGDNSSAATGSGILIDFILESLSFRSMKNREKETAAAHGNTFDWIFDTQSHTVPQNSVAGDFSR